MSRSILLIFLTYISFGSASAQFESGYYYDNVGKKINGLIKHRYGARTFSDGPDNSIVFKENKNAKKIDLSTDEITSFVIKSDSFTILRNFSINSLAYYSSDFVKVVEIGRINLYYHYTTIPNQYGSSTAITYLISTRYSIKSINKKSFQREYKMLFAEHKDLIDKIETNKLRFDDFREIVKEYNQFMSSKK